MKDKKQQKKPLGKQFGLRGRRTVLAEDVIAGLTPNPLERASLAAALHAKSEFLQPDFLQKLITGAGQIREQAALLNDPEAIVLVSLDGYNRFSLALPAQASTRVADGSYRIASLAELRRRQLAKQEAPPAPEPIETAS